MSEATQAAGTTRGGDVSGGVDVIVPVAGAPDDLARCAASLLATVDLARHRVVLVLDGPQEEAVEAVARDLADGGGDGVLVVRNPERMGFVRSVNRGMGLSSRDVILLNSDTVVTAGWVEKLQAAAASAPEVATVTPFSNNATICSLPEWLVENALPTGETIESFARRVEASSQRAYPRLPTGVGFCLFIKRAALDRLGLFDAEAFGEGYGEEVEFCLRAAAAGWVHVLDDATFVYHAGQRSFGRRRKRRVAAAHREITRLHPSYLPAIGRFVREDPLRPLRERVLASPDERQRASARERSCPPVDAGPGRVLHLVHGWPPYNFAGVEVYARGLAVRQAAWREVLAYSRLRDRDRELGDVVELHDEGVRVRLVVNNFDQRNPLARNALDDRTLTRGFARFVAETRPDLVHVHHLAGHGLALPGVLHGVLRRRGIPFVLHLHDWWLLCARANLLDRDRQPCGGPGAAKCARCLPPTQLPPAGLWGPLLYALRAGWARRVVRQASALVVGSVFVEESLRSHGLLEGARAVHRVPYGVEIVPPRREKPVPHRPLRFGCIGSLLPHKGIHVAVAAFRGIDPGQASLEIWGDPAASPAYMAELEALATGSPVAFRGRFAEADKAALLGDLDALVVPSIGLESFGLVAREALACGTPILASRTSGLAELAGALPAEAFFAPGNAAALRQRVLALAERPETLAEWSRALPPVRTMDDSAAEMEEVYSRVLGTGVGAEPLC